MFLHLGQHLPPCLVLPPFDSVWLLCLEDFKYFQNPPRSFWGQMRILFQTWYSTSRNTFVSKKTCGSGPIRISCAFTSPQMSSHGFVVVAPTDGDQKVLVHPKDGWINCQDLCALHLHSPSTWHQFWNQKMAQGACLGSRLDTWNGENSLYLWEDCWEAHEYKQWKLEDSSQNTYTRTKSSCKSFYCFFRVFDSYIHLSRYLHLSRVNPPSPSCRAAVILPSLGHGHLSRLTLRDDTFLPGRSGLWPQKWGRILQSWNAGISFGISAFVESWRPCTQG